MISNTLSNKTARREEITFTLAEPIGLVPTFSETITDRLSAEPENEMASLAHDLRTVINVLTGTAEALSQTTLTVEQKSLVETMKFGADNMLGLINNFLDFTKLQVSDIDFNCQPFDLCELVFSLKHALQIQAKGRDVDIFTEIGSETVGLFPVLDVLRLRKIMFNLLDNALKFTQKGRITLAVHLAKPDILEFRVSDTGSGMAPEALENIFKPFWREKGKSVGGTGLGLTIVRELVERQGGQIRVESHVGLGSDFTVTIPFERSSFAPNATNSGETGHLLRGCSLLAVDDNPLSLRLLHRLFEAWGCEFDFAGTAHEARELAEKKCFDLILLDVNLPDQDGLTLANIIRRSEESKNRRTPLIGVSGANLSKNHLRVFDAFLEKPYTSQALHNLLLRFQQQKTERLSMAPIQPDFSYLLTFCDGDRQFTSEIIDLFLQNAPEAIQQLQTAASEENIHFIYQLSHRLKSNFFTLGIHSLENMALSIERMCQANSPDKNQIIQLTRQLAVQSEACLPVIREALSELS